jgi:RHS repeat-associated protein
MGAGRCSRAVAAVLGGLVCAGLVAGVVSPVWASDPGDGGSSWPVGGFAVGDGVEALVDERSGGVSFALAAGGISLGWDARLVAVDRYGLGVGWSVAGVGFVDVEGGVRVFPANRGVFPADASVPSGLSGYVLEDLRFEQVADVLPARADGLAGEREYAFRLIELGGTVSYFDAVGNPVARVDAFENRTDWSWARDGSHRLVTVVTDVGVVTELDWADPARVEVSTRAGAGPASVSVVELDGGRLAEVVDAAGGRSMVGYTAAGLVSRLGSVSGAVTEFSWQRLTDGSAAVDRVRVVDADTGEVFSERVWEPVAGLASGWPAVHDVQATAGATAVASGRAFSTVVSDGVTRIVSEYSDRQTLTARNVMAADRSGERVLQEQVFEYPGDDGDGVPAQVDRPERAVVTHWNASGASRVVEEGFVFDELGRLVRHAAADGTVTETEYDSEPGAHGIPIGLPLNERVTASDGLVSESWYELNPARTAVVAAESWTGEVDDREPGPGLSRAGRVEFEIDPDGFVTVERMFPQGGLGEAVVTTHEKTVDLGSGELTLSETVAAGTELAATTTTVSDLLHGQPLAVTDVMGHPTTTEYDARGRPVRVEDAAGRALRTEYRTRQQHGVNATVVTAPGGVVTTTETDVLGRVRRIVDNIDHGTAIDGQERVVESRAYPEPGVVEVTDAWGATTRAEHDGLGRPVKSIAPSGLTEVRTYDDATQEETRALTPTGGLADAEVVTTARTDELERVATSTGARRDGVPVLPSTTRWDGFGREASVTEAGRATRTDFDAFGNPIVTTTTAEADDAELVASREFDAYGASTQKTLSDATGSRSAGIRELDLLGRTRTEVDPAGNTTSYTYTPDGLIARVETSGGQATAHTYDAITRDLVETVTTSPVGDTVRTALEYDPETGVLLAVFDPANRDATIVAYESDAWANTTAVAYPDGAEVRYGYDRHGRRDWVEDVAGARTRYTYTSSGEIAGVVQEGRSGGPAVEVGYEYDAFGRVGTVTRGNGTTTRYAYTSMAEVASEVTTRPDGTVDARREYAYSPSGTLTARTDLVRDPDPDAEEVTTTSYRYDGFDRLTGSTLHGGSTTEAPVRQRVEYALSVSGDLTRETTTTRPGTEGEELTIRDYGYTAAGQLTTLTTTHADGSVTVAIQDYDAAGNLVLGHDGTRYAYDARNRPVAETTAVGEVVRTGYWATGQRERLTAHDPDTGTERETRFYWDGTALLADTHTTDADAEAVVGRATASYLSGVMRHARTITPSTAGTAGAGTGYYGHDRHGNVTDLTTGEGEPARYAYDDYGARLPHSDAPRVSAAALVGDVDHQPFGYAGEYTNPTGTQHLQVRTYDPATRRFQQLDLADQHNPYWYGNANPITHIDPSGQTAKIDWLAVSLAGVGLALSCIGLGMAAYGLGVAIFGAMSWGGGAAVVTGTKVALGITFGLAVADTVVTTLVTIDEFVTKMFDEDVALALSITAAAAGLGSIDIAVTRKLVPARNLREAFQKYMHTGELTWWRLTHDWDMTLPLRQTPAPYRSARGLPVPFDMPGAVFSRAFGHGPGTANAAQLIEGERAALAVQVDRLGASHAETTYMILNPRFRSLETSRTTKQPEYLNTQGVTGAFVDQYMQERNIKVLYIEWEPKGADLNRLIQHVPATAAEDLFMGAWWGSMWVRNPSAKTKMVFDRF